MQMREKQERNKPESMKINICFVPSGQDASMSITPCHGSPSKHGASPIHTQTRNTGKKIQRFPDFRVSCVQYLFYFLHIMSYISTETGTI